MSRTTDLVARYGGEEFVILMPATDKKGAYQAAHRIKTIVEKNSIEHKYSSVAEIITVSIGVSSLSGDALNKETLFKQADQSLYQAKENGRNQVVLYKA